MQFFVFTVSLPYFIATFLIGYLLGSIPFGLIVTRLAGTGDIRNVGSGNIGATNVLRTGRKGLAVATLLGDMLKGTAAVLLVNWFTASRPLSSAWSRGSARCSVTSIQSGSNSKAAKASPPTSAC